MMKEMKSWVKKLPEPVLQTAYLKFFSWTQIPLLAFLNPKVVESSDEHCVVKIALSRRSKNHLNSMYFAALCAGADVAAGLPAMKHIQESGQKVSLSFKQFQAEFFKRAEGDTFFSNHQGEEIKAFVAQVISSGERCNMPINIEARVPEKFGDEIVAKFCLELSLKCKKRSN